LPEAKSWGSNRAIFDPSSGTLQPHSGLENCGEKGYSIIRESYYENAV
jgi:hypothetical protein